MTTATPIKDQTMGSQRKEKQYDWLEIHKIIRIKLCKKLKSISLYPAALDEPCILVSIFDSPFSCGLTRNVVSSSYSDGMKIEALFGIFHWLEAHSSNGAGFSMGFFWSRAHVTYLMQMTSRNPLIERFPICDLINIIWAFRLRYYFAFNLILLLPVGTRN